MHEINRDTIITITIITGPCSSTGTDASYSPTGWLIYGVSSASLRRWLRCFSAAKFTVSSNKTASEFMLENNNKQKQKQSASGGSLPSGRCISPSPCGVRAETDDDDISSACLATEAGRLEHHPRACQLMFDTYPPLCLCPLINIVVILSPH